MLTQLDKFWQKPWIYILLLTSFASAMPLAFAPYYHFWLMPLLFGAFIRLLELKPHAIARSTYYFSWVTYSLQFWWIHTALHDISGLSNLHAIPLTLLLPAFLAIFPTFAMWFWGKYTHLSRFFSLGLLLPAWWTLGEFAREHALTGFGWGALGYSQIADNSPLAGFAPLGGIHLLTFITACISAWLVLLIDQSEIKQRLIALSALVIVLLAGGALRHYEFTKESGEPVSVALIQGNIPQQLKFDPKIFASTYQRYLEQIRQTHAKIVLLPETALPEFLQNTPQKVLFEFAQTAQNNGSDLAVGIPALTPDGNNYLNAIVLLSQYDPVYPEKMPLYAKDHLVPFGEYKPLPLITNPLYEMMHMPLSGFVRGGQAQQPFDMANQKIAFNICYEDGFGDELIASAKQSTLLANASNMAWYGDSNAMWQQLQQSQARALELGRNMIRATNTGATAIVSHQGKIIAQATPNTIATLEGTVQGRMGQTPYMRMGSSLPIISVLILITLIFIRWR